MLFQKSADAVGAIAFDGTLYHKEVLRQSLEAQGRFCGTSDGALVLESYLLWGADCLSRLEGVFSFAIWQEGRLFLARDPLGLKPLFYCLHRDGLLFGSEQKMILAYPSMQAAVDEAGAAELLLMGPGRTPGSGVFRGIRELLPGQYGVYEGGRLKLKRYWNLQDREHREDLCETADQVRFLVTRSIRQQMQGKVAACLSGGLDSSIICAVCAGELREQGEKLTTFSVDYRDQERYFRADAFQPNEDRYYIGLMEKALDTRHRTVTLGPEELAEGLQSAMLARDLPGMGDVDVSLLLLCRAIRREAPAALSGEGADEIFGGYPWYQDREDGFPWARNQPRRLALLHPAFRRKRLEDYAAERWREAVRGCDVLPEQAEAEKRIKIMMQLNLFWFMQTLSERNDRMSTRAGLEMRTPLCTPAIAEYLYAVPWAMKQDQGREKGLLRRAFQGCLPEPVLWRKKSPYPKTFDPRFSQQMEQRLRCLLKQRDAPLFALVDRRALLEEGEMDTPWYGQLMRRPQTIAWLLQLEGWLEEYHVDVIS